MDDTILRQLLAGGETEQVAFVAGEDRAARIEEAACSFLNAGGGTILVGVDGDGKPIGVEAADEHAESIRRSLAASISPPAPFSVMREELDGKPLIVVDVPRGPEKPYVAGGRIMIRRGATVAQASASDIASLIGQRALGEGRWERLPAPGIEADDLDMALVREAASRIREARGYRLDDAKDPLRILEKLNLLSSGQFTNAALILFGKNPAGRYPQTRARAARFRGETRAEFIDNRAFEGNLFALIEALTSFIEAHVPVSSSLAPGQLYRRDEPAYPWPAVREALVNALVHRDYAAFDGGMAVAIHDDRIEFWNSGRLPAGMTVDDLRALHPSRPTNPDIAQVCFLYGLMERWGIGTRKIIEACESHGLPEPSWKVDENGVTLTLRRIEGGRAREARNPLNLRQLTVAERLRPGEKLTLADYEKLVSSEVKRRQARADLMQLTQAGFLKRIGSGRATVYVRTSQRVDELNPG